MTVEPTREQIEQYRSKGFVRVRGVFGAEEVAEWAAESRRLLRVRPEKGDAARVVAYRTTGGLGVVDRLNPVIDLSSVFASLVEDVRILLALRALCGEEMRLFWDKLIYRMPGVPGYRLHQDYAWWQQFPRPLASAIVSIDAARADNGGVEFFAGCRELLTTPGEERFINDAEAARMGSAGEVVETEPGDVIFFDALTPHRSGVNLSAGLRRQLYLTYSPARCGDLYGAAHEHVLEGRRGG